MEHTEKSFISSIYRAFAQVEDHAPFPRGAVGTAAGGV